MTNKQSIICSYPQLKSYDLTVDRNVYITIIIKPDTA